MEINIGSLVKYDLTPDSYALMYSLYNKVNIPFRHKAEIDNLESEGWIKRMENNDVILREKGNKLFEQETAIVLPSVEPITNFAILISDFRDLFPAGTQDAGRALKGSRAGCIRKMKKFLKDNPNYSEAHILDATAIYLGEFRRNQKDWRFAMNADYFIEKNGGSTLETYCEMLENGEISEKSHTDNILDL